MIRREFITLPRRRGGVAALTLPGRKHNNGGMGGSA
jgi:hypothetical protein